MNMIFFYKRCNTLNLLNSIFYPGFHRSALHSSTGDCIGAYAIRVRQDDWSPRVIQSIVSPIDGGTTS